ncbi:MAG: hypothetical protein P8Y39_09825, partial [Nitrospirota bacterium]
GFSYEKGSRTYLKIASGSAPKSLATFRGPLAERGLNGGIRRPEGKIVLNAALLRLRAISPSVLVCRHVFSLSLRNQF